MFIYNIYIYFYLIHNCNYGLASSIDFRDTWFMNNVNLNILKLITTFA